MKVIILAAGKGTRMENENLPKVLIPLNGKPLIQHVLDTVMLSGIDQQPVVVTGYKGELVREVLKDYPVTFVDQFEQKGTAHAVAVCEASVSKEHDILVLYGDMPFISVQTLHRLKSRFEDSCATIALVTYKVPHFDVYEGAFQSFGRILRSADNVLLGIKEAKDATPLELLIREVNPAFFLFFGDWIWSNIKKVNTQNAQSEFYLTDLLDMAVRQEELVVSVEGENLHEALGVNTPDQLQVAHRVLDSLLLNEPQDISQPSAISI